MFQNSEWKCFPTELGHFLFHIPSSSIIQLADEQWQLLSMISNEEKFQKLQEWTQNIFPSIPYTPLKISIRHVALNVAQRCNLRCTYCYAGEGDYGKEDLMTFTTAQKALRLFKNLEETLHITFFGGEALMNFPLIQSVVKWCEEQEERFTYSITTNAVFLKEEHLDFFKTHRFQVKISYDGKKLQSVQRTPNKKLSELVEKKLHKFESTLKSMRSFYLRSTISKKHLEDFADNLLKTLNSHSYKVHFARVSSNEKGEQFTEDEMKAFRKILTETTEKLIKEEDWEALARIRNFRQHIRTLHYGKKQPFCSAGIQYLSVSTEGKFYLCHRFTEDSEACIGDVGRGLDIEKIEEIRDFRKHKEEPCRSCWMRKMCQGGCFHEHKMATSQKTKIDKTFCQLQDTEMSLALRIYLQLRQKAPELLESILK